MAMIEITTKSSMSVKPRRVVDACMEASSYETVLGMWTSDECPLKYEEWILRARSVHVSITFRPANEKDGWKKFIYSWSDTLSN